MSVPSVVWHAVTVILAGVSVGLLWITVYRNPAMVWLISGVQLGFAALFLGCSWVDLGTLWTMPQ